MSTKYIASNWRLPNQENSSKNDNYGLTFNGSNEYIDLGSPSELDFQTGEMTLSCWIYSETVSSIKPILGNSNSGASSYQYLLDVNRTAAKISFLTSGVSTLTSNLTISANTWYHICLTRSGTTSNWVYTMYINGSSSDGGTLSTSTNPPATQTVAIGKYGALGGYYFQGKISNFCAFNEALTSTQISTLYGSSSLGSGNPMALTPQPVAYYPLGDNSASNPLTQPNVAVEDASVFDFDGSDDYVNLNTTLSSLGVTTSFSISTWVNISTLGIYDTVIGAPAAYSTWNDGFGLMVYNNALYFWVEDWNDANHFVQTATLNTSQWYHIVCTFSTSNGLKIYVDSGTPTTASNTEIGTLTFPMFIGSTGTNTSYVFNGKISNTQIWNTELSASDVSTLYNSGVPLYTGTQPQAANLKAWYKLNNTANWEADSAGNWQIPEATSAYPQSFEFNSSNSTFISNNGPNFTGEFTFSGWFKTTSTSTETIWAALDGSTNKHFLRLSGGNTIRVKLFDASGGNTNTDNTTTYNDGNWHHIAFTTDGLTTSNGIKVYLDGSLLSTQGTLSNAGFISTNKNNIGAYNASTWLFNGNLSNIQFFNSVIPATGTDSVETLYNNGSPLTTAIASSNLKLWAKLDNSATFSTNWSIPDASGNGNTGTSSGMTEQSLVNNNVSTLNGESSGMTSANLVTSDLTRAIPYGDGYSFNFDSGSSDYIDLGSADYIEGITTMSISGWFNPHIAGVGGAAGIIAKESRDFYVGWYSSPANSIRFLISDDDGVTKDSLNSLSLGSNADVLNKWHHFVCTWDASDKLKIYINGALNAETNSVNATSSLPTSTNNLEIGRRVSTYFDGQISNCSIFNEALTSTEVQKLYANGVPQDLSSFTPQPSAWYPLGSNSFWNGSTWTVRDMSAGGSNDGTSANIGVDGLVGDAPRSEANGTGTNMDVPSNLEGNTKWSSNNSYSVNMSSLARVEDVA